MAVIDKRSGGAPGFTYYLSQNGCISDCDLDTCLTPEGAQPTDNAAAINALVSTATEAAPVHIVIDGAYGIGDSIVIPATGYVTFEGSGRGTGFGAMDGANSTPFITDGAEWSPGVQAIAGRGVAFRNFRLNPHRGTLVDGRCNSTTGDLRGEEGVWWLTGFHLEALEDVEFTEVEVYDSPSFAFNLYSCKDVVFSDIRVDSPGRSPNTDGIHLNGGCQQVRGTNLWFRCGDDGIAINTDEGGGGAGADFVFSNVYLDNCLNGFRVYGRTTRTQSVVFDNWTGTVSGVLGIVSHNAGSSQEWADCNHSITLSNWDVQYASGTGGIILYKGSAGVLTLDNFLLHPVSAGPLVVCSSDWPVVSSIRLRGVHMQRAAGHNSNPALVALSGGEVRDLYFDGVTFSTSVGGYTAIPALITAGGGSIGRLHINGLDLQAYDAQVTSVIGSGATIGAYVGDEVWKLKGSVSAIADSSAGPNTLYVGSDHGNRMCYKDSGGTVYVVGNQMSGWIEVPAVAIAPDTTGGATGPTQVELGTNKQNLQVLDFADGATSYAQFTVPMPGDWNGGTVTAKFLWCADDATTNAVVWQIEGLAYGDGSALDVAWGTARSVTDANGGVAYQERRSAATAALTLGGSPAANTRAQFRIARLGTDGSDSLTVAARLLGVEITYTRA